MSGTLKHRSQLEARLRRRYFTADRTFDLGDRSGKRCVDPCQLSLEHQEFAIGFDQTEKVGAASAIVRDRQSQCVFASRDDSLCSPGLTLSRPPPTLDLPPGYSLEAVGSFRNQIEANRRLMWIIP